MSKVLKEVVKFAGNLIKKLINSSKKRRGDENHMSAVFWIVAVCVGLLFLLMSVTEVLVGPVATFTDAISSFFKEKEYTQEEMEYILADAGRLAVIRS